MPITAAATAAKTIRLMLTTIIRFPSGSSGFWLLFLARLRAPHRSIGLTSLLLASSKENRLASVAEVAGCATGSARPARRPSIQMGAGFLASTYAWP
jgi:hypothetical protein